VDIYNVFNFQGVTARDQRYTIANVRPIPDGKQADLATRLVHSDGTAFNPTTDKNPNYMNPTAYQEPRQFRLSAKVSF
jgi:hypothetical protein